MFCSPHFIAMVALSQRRANKGLHLSRPFLFFLLLVEGFAEVQYLTGVCSDMYIMEWLWGVIHKNGGVLVFHVPLQQNLGKSPTLQCHICRYLLVKSPPGAHLGASSASWWSPMSLAIMSALSTSASPSSTWPGQVFTAFLHRATKRLIWTGR